MLDASPRMVLGVLFVVLVASTDTTASRQSSNEPSVFFTLHLDTYDTPAPVSSFHPDAERLLPPPPPPAHTTASLDEEDAASPPPSVRAIVVDRVVSGAAGRDFLRNGDASALVVAPLSAARLDHSRTLDALNRSATLGGGALESADVYPPSFAQWRAGGLFEERHPKGESVLVAALDCGDRITDDARDPVCLTRAHGTSLAAVVGREGKITATFGAATIVSDAELRTVDSQLFQARVERSNDAVAVSWLQVRAMLGIHEEVAFAFLMTGKRRVAAAAAAAASDARQRSWGQQPATLLRNMADLVLPYVVLDDATLNHRAVDGVRTTPPPFADLTRSLGEGVASSNVFLSQQHSLDGFVGTTAKTAKELLSLCQDSGGIVVGVARRIATAAAASTTGSELSVDDASHHVCEKRADNAEGTCNGGRATNGASLVLPVHELELAPVCIAHPEEGPLSPRQEARLSTWYAAVMRPYVSELRDPKQALLHRETDEARLHPQRFDRRAFVKHSSAHVVLVLSADHEVMGFVDDLKRWASPAPEPACLAVLREASVLARWRLQQSSADDATLHHELRFDAAYFDASAHAQMAHWMTSWPATRQRAEEDEPAGSEVEYGEAGPCHFGALVRFAATPGRVAAGPVVRRTFCPRARTGDELLRCASSVLEWSRSWRRWTVDDDSDAMPRRIVGNLDRLRGGLTQDAHDWRRVTTGLRSLIGPDSGSALGFLIGPSDGCAACAAFRVHTYPTLVEARLKDVRAQLETKMVLLVAPTMPSNHESLFHARRRGLASLLTKLLVDDALVSSFPAVFFVNFTHITVQALTDTGTDGGGPLDAVLAFAADHGLVAAATSTPRPYSMRRLPSRSAIASYQQQRGVVNDKRKDHNDDDEESTPVRWS